MHEDNLFLQFARGKEEEEEVPPGHYINKKIKTDEGQLCTCRTPPTSGTKSHFPFNHTASASAPSSASASASLPPPQPGMKKSTMKFKQEDSSTAVGWSPEDDGIEIQIPSSSIEKPAAREAVDSYINAVLYGPSRRRRLPVFEEICPAEE
ncbi:hypothetical protein NE237_027290 [Protea cynaroides]|uniref:Uncharacterized protein n=1 Tax=Protea cynaroides TaxID=273540 RepID=A0A9Q0GMN9_9MAGN|nr:hypothetical protein NE237_027290 [Protea cynaroides]